VTLQFPASTRNPPELDVLIFFTRGHLGEHGAQSFFPAGLSMFQMRLAQEQDAHLRSRKGKSR